MVIQAQVLLPRSPRNEPWSIVLLQIVITLQIQFKHFPPMSVVLQGKEEKHVDNNNNVDGFHTSQSK